MLLLGSSILTISARVYIRTEWQYVDLKITMGMHYSQVDTPESCRDRYYNADECGACITWIIVNMNYTKDRWYHIRIQYRCCWILEKIVNGVNNNLDYTTTENSVFDTVDSVTDSILEVDESAFNTAESTVSDSSNTSSLSASLAEKCYIANFALLIRSLLCEQEAEEPAQRGGRSGVKSSGLK